VRAEITTTASAMPGSHSMSSKQNKSKQQKTEQLLGYAMEILVQIDGIAFRAKKVEQEIQMKNEIAFI
jgi:hypothetical protein